MHYRGKLKKKLQYIIIDTPHKYTHIPADQIVNKALNHLTHYQELLAILPFDFEVDDLPPAD